MYYFKVFAIFFSFVASYFDDYLKKSIETVSPAYYKTINNYLFLITFIVGRITEKDIDMNTIVEYINGNLFMGYCMFTFNILIPPYCNTLEICTISMGTVTVTRYGNFSTFVQ